MLGSVLNYVSGRNASKEQERSNQRAQDLLERQYEEGKQARADFLAGDEYSNLMSILSGNQDTPNFTSYQDFANSDQANQGITNASRRALNAFSGMGNFGSTGSFADLVRTQDSTLGNLFNANRQMEMDEFNTERALRGDRVNEALIPLNIIQSTLDANQTAGVNYANTQGQNYMDQGAIRAGRSKLPAQTYNQLQQQLSSAFLGVNMAVQQPINYFAKNQPSLLESLQAGRAAQSLMSNKNAMNERADMMQRKSSYEQAIASGADANQLIKEYPEFRNETISFENQKRQLRSSGLGEKAFIAQQAVRNNDPAAQQLISEVATEYANIDPDDSFTPQVAQSIFMGEGGNDALNFVAQLGGFKSPQQTTKQRDFEYLKSLSPEDRALFGEAQRGKQTPIDVQIENQERKDNQAIKTAARKKEAELGVTELNKIANDSKAAGNQLNTISRLKTLNDKAFAGTGAEFALGVGKIAKEAGIPVEGVSASTQFKAIANELVLNKSQQMSGALSNADMEFLKETAPTLSQDREGRAKMLEYAEALAKREKEYAKQAQAFKKRNGYFNRSEFQQEFDQYAEENPLFDGENQEQTPQDNSEIIITSPIYGEVTEADIQETMRANNLTREQVLARLQGG